jgi:hypothetical protein
MPGMQIFESNGTFTPVIGTAYKIIAVGGGAGGSTVSTNGTAAGASSFGSIVTAAGGSLRYGGLPGRVSVASTSSLAVDSSNIIIGQSGKGLNGGQSGRNFTYYLVSSAPNVYSFIAPGGGGDGGYLDGAQAGNGDSGGGGRGWGAGGGGSYAGPGGGAGLIKTALWVPTSSTSIPITIGAGGGAVTYTYPGTALTVTSGVGAPGVVIVMW